MEDCSFKLLGDSSKEMRNKSKLEIKRNCATEEDETDITILMNIQNIEVL